MQKLIDIVRQFETIAPEVLQENYDNTGIQLGDFMQEVKGVLVTLDLTMEVIDEAISLKANLIISHHPLFFKGIKKLSGQNYVEQIAIKAIKNDVAIYTIHTNLDNIISGVNKEICNRLNLKNCKVLSPAKDLLCKLVTFVPFNHIDAVRNAIFDAGAGTIGNYDSCSYNIEGLGSFRAGKDTNPFVGEKGKIHFEKEIRFETIFPEYNKGKIISALMQTHPYEEVAYDIYQLKNTFNMIGAGCIGELEKDIDEKTFLQEVKKTFKTGAIRHTKLFGKSIKKVAVCGGSGSFLLDKAIKQKADIFISSDFKYHQFFDTMDKIIIADIGHYESEQFTKDLIYSQLMKKMPKFAVHLSKINTNPINYL